MKSYDGPSIFRNQSSHKTNKISSQRSSSLKLPKANDIRQDDLEKGRKKETKKSFRPTHFPSIYQGKTYQSPQAIHQKRREWYQKMKDLLEKEDADYLLTKEYADRVFYSKSNQRTTSRQRKRKINSPAAKRVLQKDLPKIMTDEQIKLGRKQVSSTNLFSDFTDKLPEETKSKNRPKNNH